MSKVYCKNCFYLGHALNNSYRCLYYFLDGQLNPVDTWYEKKTFSHTEDPSKVNKNNDCGWYMDK